LIIELDSPPSQNLDRPLPIKGDGTLRTIRNACDYMSSFGKQRELRPHWQQAESRAMTVSRAPELALFMDAKLDVSKLPANDGAVRVDRGLSNRGRQMRRPPVRVSTNVRYCTPSIV
jgi:hypothetical protein